MPIATGVERDSGVAAVLAARDMPSKVCRAAGLDCAHDLQLIVAEMAPHGVSPCGTMVAENIRDLQRWPGHVSRST